MLILYREAVHKKPNDIFTEFVCFLRRGAQILEGAFCIQFFDAGFSVRRKIFFWSCDQFREGMDEINVGQILSAQDNILGEYSILAKTHLSLCMQFLNT